MTAAVLRAPPATLGRVAAGIAFTLTAFGVLMIYSQGTFWAAQRYDDAHHFVNTQVFGAAVGLAAFLVGAFTPYRLWGRRARDVVLVSAALLVLVLVLGDPWNGARRWLRIGGFGFQPSEIAKAAVVTWAAAFAAGRAADLSDFRRGFLPAILPIVLLMGLTLVEPDFGTALFLGALGLVVLIVGGLRLAHVLLCGCALLPVLTIAMITKFGYIGDRISFYFGEETSHQVRQAYIALGSGGFFGKGIGAGAGKLFFLPEVAGDFIFPAIGEEVGFAGVAVVFALFMGFCFCGWRIARAALKRDAFAGLLAIGITTWIGLQAAANLAVVSGSVPTKGIALPFISYGGSALVTTLGAVGVLVNIARSVDPRAAAPGGAS